MRAPLVLTAAIALLGGAFASPALATAAVAETVFIHTCSPNDQLALQITIPTPDNQSLEVRLWGEALDNLASGELLMLSMNTRQQTRVDKDIYLCNDRHCDATKGQLRVGTYRAMDFFDGELLWHNEGTVLSLPFIARFADNPNPCG